jgi:hypothetical protein
MPFDIVPRFNTRCGSISEEQCLGRYDQLRFAYTNGRNGSTAIGVIALVADTIDSC